MSTQQIRDQKGHLLGTISTGPNQQLMLVMPVAGSSDPMTRIPTSPTTPLDALSVPGIPSPH